MSGFCRYGYKTSNDVRECAFLEQLSENKFSSILHGVIQLVSYLLYKSHI